MRNIPKNSNSPIVTKKLRYPTHAEKIRTTLEMEQQYFCAYTEERLTALTSIDVEHFDPTRKYTELEDYPNWFAVIHKWNLKKGDASRWAEHQPVLSPTADDLQARIFLREAYYELADLSDKEAENLCLLVHLNDPVLVRQRESYLEQLRNYEQKHGRNGLYEMLIDCSDMVRFPTLLKTHFDFEIFPETL
jgi:hypothetical protein